MDKLLKSIKKKSFLSQYIVPGLFFVVLLGVGLSIYKDYGISWDEPLGRKNGVFSALYANHKLDYLFLSEEKVDTLIDTFVDKSENKHKYSGATLIHEYKDKQYGVIFEFYQLGIEFLTGNTDKQFIYQLRHLLTFLFFFAGMFIFYFLGLEIFKDWKLALLACIFLVLSPRIFAHSFYNPKDIPFMSAYIWAIYSMIKFLKRKNVKWALLHATATAILIAIRIPGILIPVMTILFLLLDKLSGYYSEGINEKFWVPSIIYILSAPTLIILFWPYLWENPLGNFMDSFHNFSRFRSDTYLLFWGKLVWSKSLPQYYTLSWIAITTPILYLLLFVAGIIFLIKNVFDQIKDWSFYKSETTRDRLFIGITWAAPLLALFIFDSVLYNGWRHSYFIYPSLIIIAVSAIPEVLNKTRQVMGLWGSKVLMTMGLMYMAYMIFITYRLHPYQQDYFNFLAGKSLEQNFDVDYWGLSYKDGIDYLIRQEGTSAFSVGAHIPYPAVLNANMFTKAQRERIRFYSIEDSMSFDYLFVTGNDRYKHSKIEKYDLSNFQKVKVISSGDIPLLEIYKAKAK